MEYEPIIDIVEDIFGEHRRHNEYKGQISYDCPVCSYDIKNLDHGDGKGNLELNYKMGVFKCWSCAETHDTYGTLYKLIKKYGLPRHLKRYQLLKPDEEQTSHIYKKVMVLPKEYIQLSDVSNGFKLTHHYKQVINYLKGRNINDELIKKHKIGFCYNGNYSNMVIIPSYNIDNELNYFIARSYLSKTKIKYKNPEAQKETIIWNEHFIDWSKKVYLVEGVFDSIFLPNSIPMLGKYLSDLLFNKLYDKSESITIILDGDAWDDTERLYHRLNCGKLMGRVSVVKLPKDKDIADLQGNLIDFPEFKLD
jgi:DNA primase